MFRIESYITPIIWSYFSKYVKNFNSHDFHVSLWNGGAVFSNLELNLDVLDSELQIPLTFASGHIQELKITVPWRKITSEPIVLNVKSMELVLKYREVDGGANPLKTTEEILPPRDDPSRNDENAGYMRGLISKIVTNVRVNFENVVIKYVESDIAFSVNVGEASLSAADENWKDTFLANIVYSPDFILRKKLSFSDVNICLDRCNNAGVVDKFHDPMLYRCDFDVRIIQKFATTYSRTPYFYRMDLFLGHLQFCVTDEQIPMLVRLYNLFTWLMQSGSMDASQENDLDESVSTTLNDTGNASVANESLLEQSQETIVEKVKLNEEQPPTWTGWATSWLYYVPVAMFGEEYNAELDETKNEEAETTDVKIKPPTPPPLPPSPAPFSPEKKFPDGFQLPPPTTHFGVFIKTLTIIFKSVQRSCDRPPAFRRRIINIFPFLKCSIQGICCDFILRGSENSHTLGVSSIMVHGLGFCPCGVHDCSSSAGGIPTQGGECYFEAGKIMPDFSSSSLFQPDGAAPPEWCYDTNHKDCLNYESESKLLDKTPAIFLKYIVTRSEVDKNDQSLQTSEISEILYHCVAAPCKVLLCSGLVHRLKMINNAINNYGYEPYGFQPLPMTITRYGNLSADMNYPVTTYRLVIRQPLIEILAADHPADYSAEKRADYFRKSGGFVVPSSTIPRLSPEWPRMIISCDILECTAEDRDNHFFRLKNRLVEDPVVVSNNENTNNNKLSRQRRKSFPQGAELVKWFNQKKAKTATFKFRIMEALMSFVSEPVELNIGVKSGTVQLDFSNYHFYSFLEILHRSKGSIYMESVTCSTRLQQRSNVLWLPFTFKIDTLFDWEPTLLQPSLSVKLDANSLTLFIGPETIIALTQLNEKLSVYLQEFLPRARIKSQRTEVPNHSTSPKMSLFSDSFKSESLEKWMVSKDVTCIPECSKGVGICTSSHSVLWRYPQRRTLRSLSVDALPFSFEENQIGGPYLMLVVDFFEEFSDAFHHFYSFTMIYGKGKTIRFMNDEKNIISATVWRLRLNLVGMQPGEGSSMLDSLANCMIVESMHMPEMTFMSEMCEVNLNLVNNTYYAGKEIGNSALQSYLNTDGVSPDDHIMATLQFKQCKIFYSAVDTTARCNADFSMDLKVLDYESLVLEDITEPVFVGMAMTLPDSHGCYSLNLVTNSVNFKVGASLVHSVMYSKAMWNQVINSFDSHKGKMIATESQTKIILNRVLMCNDLNTEIQIRSTHPECLGAESIPSKDCKAVSFPSNQELKANPGNVAQLYLSCCDVPKKEIEIDIYKSGYTTKEFDNNRIAFINVSNLSASQKLVKVSGPVILANGLDQAIEISLFPYSSLGAIKSTLPSRGVGPTFLYSIQDIEHFRLRFVSCNNGNVQNPWSDIIYTNDLVEAEGSGPVSSILVALLRQTEHSISKTQVWLTLVSEEIKGKTRYLVVVSPIYCLRSWLCGETFVHLTSADETTSDMCAMKGKGEEVQIKFCGESGVTHHMKFQSNLNVPPSLTSVPLLPAGPLLETKQKVKPIDELLAQITKIRIPDSPSTSKSVANSDLKWPFITEDIPTNEWNTEINPETEIMVTFTPWVEGLPTAVADIRPWALIINLSGVELLFAQEACSDEEDENDWDQFWVPYKCVFSPKPIKIPSGKFRLGVMMNDFLVKSPSLQFSDQPERLNVKKINKDGKVPIDCFSRLDLFGGSQVACLTIETRIRNKILVMTVRPTYSIQNRAPFEVYAEGVTISSAVPQRRESWADARLSMYTTLDPWSSSVMSDNPSDKVTAMPILHFTTDGQDYSALTPSYKYLALSCGGPWWFVQLVDCSETSQVADGIPGTKTAVTLPKVDCGILSPLFRHKLKNFKIASEAVVVGSYTKNGQVWISISQDNAPQLMFHNKSSLPLFYAEKNTSRDQPKHHTSCFEQYLMIPPKSSCHFSFANAYNIFPQLNKKEAVMPDLMMAEVSQDLVDFVASHQAQSLVAITERPRQHKVPLSTPSSTSSTRPVTVKLPSGNLLFPDFDIEWQSLLNVHNNPTQYAKFGRQSVKLTVEIVGYTHHVFIENTKLKEVSAKAVRNRFTSAKGSKSDDTMSKTSQESHPTSAQLSKSKDSTLNGDITITIGDDDEDDAESASQVSELVQRNVSVYRPWKIKAFIPELYISVQDDFDCVKESDSEFMGLAFESIILEQVPIIEDSKMRPVECPRRESWIYAVRFGNVQIDTPPAPTKRPAEFSVMLEPVKKSTKTLYSIPTSAFDIQRFLEALEIPEILNVDSTVTVTRVAPNEINLETAWLKVLPFSLFIEDRLISYLVPSIYNILGVFNEGYVLMDKCAVPVGASKTTEKSSEEEGILKHISIVDSPSPSCENPIPFFATNGRTSFSTAQHNQRHFPTISSFGSSSGGDPELSTLFSRGITFAPTLASSSSGLNSSNSSVISSSMSNLRLASASPPPPSTMLPLEPHGSNSRLAIFMPTSNSTGDVESGSSNERENQDDNSSDLFAVSPVHIPKEIIKLFEQLSCPVRVKMIDIQGSEVELTLRTEKLLYFAMDRSVVQLRPFKAYTSVTTDFHLGLELTMHYTVGTIFTIGNPVRVLGSLELLGSPGTLARTVGTGLRDLVVYPYEGILNGPVGFVSGLGYGMASLLRSVTSGTLVSLTNWAESVSRNIDRLTLDEQEQLISEASRQIELQGFTDGFVQGLSGFGIRILGAIGGLSHHPIKNVIHRGPSTSSVIGGVSRGVIGAVAKPIGGVAELISMTGQGVLLATGWKPRPKAKKPKKRDGVRKSSSESS